MSAVEATVSPFRLSSSGRCSRVLASRMASSADFCVRFSRLIPKSGILAVVVLGTQFKRYTVYWVSRVLLPRDCFQVVYIFALHSSLNTTTFCFLHVFPVTYLTSFMPTMTDDGYLTFSMFQGRVTAEVFESFLQDCVLPYYMPSWS